MVKFGMPLTLAEMRVFSVHHAVARGRSIVIVAGGVVMMTRAVSR